MAKEKGNSASRESLHLQSHMDFSSISRCRNPPTLETPTCRDNNPHTTLCLWTKYETQKMKFPTSRVPHGSPALLGEMIPFTILCPEVDVQYIFFFFFWKTQVNAWNQRHNQAPASKIHNDWILSEFLLYPQTSHYSFRSTKHLSSALLFYWEPRTLRKWGGSQGTPK